jgi:hypothetical protein
MFNQIEINIMKRKNILTIVLLFATFLNMYAQLPNEPGDPGGLSVPIDGGILMALLAGGGLLTMLFKGKKKKE